MHSSAKTSKVSISHYKPLVTVMADGSLLQEMLVAAMFQSRWSLQADRTCSTLLRTGMASVLPSWKASRAPRALQDLHWQGQTKVCWSPMSTRCKTHTVCLLQGENFLLSLGCPTALELDVDETSPGSHDIPLLHLCPEEKIRDRAAVKQGSTRLVFPWNDD